MPESLNPLIHKELGPETGQKVRKSGVRRYIGKGAPPREITKSADMIRFVTTTPGAIGYVDAAGVQPGLNVLLR